MKKFFPILTIAFCVSMFSLESCTADDSYQQDYASSQEVQEAKTKILCMAEEYGLNVRVDESSLAKTNGRVNYERLDSIFKGLMQVSGTYSLSIAKPQKGICVVRQARMLRTRSSIDNIHYYGYEFESEDKEQEGYTFTCCCKLVWSENDFGKISDIDVQPAIECPEIIQSASTVSGVGSVNDDNEIEISGSGTIELIDIYQDDIKDDFLEPKPTIYIMVNFTGLYSTLQDPYIEWSLNNVSSMNYKPQ